MTAYAQVPLLNREQLVLSWRELLPKTRDSEYREIPVDLHQKGLFLVEVTNRELRAYTLLMITDMALVSKTAPGQILLFVAHRTSGAPVEGATTVVFNNHQELARGTTDASGVYQASFKDIKVQDAIMVAGQGPGRGRHQRRIVLLLRLLGHRIRGIHLHRPARLSAHARSATSRASCGRAARASTRSTFPTRSPSKSPTPIPRRSISRSSASLPSDPSTASSRSVPLAALGTYSIIAHVGDKNVYGCFEVEEYKKPEYEVTVSTDKARYLQGESIQATISARYYFGAPVANGKVKYSIYQSRYYFPYWRILWGSEEYRGRRGRRRGYDDWYGAEVSQGTGQLDADGLLRVSRPHRGR